jgi:hypothetical protein
MIASRLAVLGLVGGAGMRTACKLVWALAAPLLGACAAAQRNDVMAGQPVSERAPAAAPTMAAVSATAATPATTATPASLANQGAVPSAELIKKGYQVMRRGNKILYCRSQRTTGSLIPTTACLTESQVRWIEQQNEQQTNDLRAQPRGGRNCPRGTSNCVGDGG